MEYREWEPYYLKILEDFGFDMEKDAEAGKILAELLKGHDPVDFRALKAMISGKDVIVVGPLAGEIPDLGRVIIATDLSTTILLEIGIVPDIIVTDLDGDVESEIEANEKGSVVLIHAHGDNISSLKRYVPRFKGKIGGTVQTEPFPPLLNFGGFTDGDRAVFLAGGVGAKRTYLTGFDFENPVPKTGKDIEMKKKKLLWAEALISIFDVIYL